MSQKKKEIDEFEEYTDQIMLEHSQMSTLSNSANTFDRNLTYEQKEKLAYLKKSRNQRLKKKQKSLDKTLTS